MMRTDDLIRQLAADVQPVRRLPTPWRLAATWLLFALLVIGAAVIVAGLRHDIAQRIMLPEERVNLATALLTGIAAAIAAFQLALPDRSARWALLPVPFAAAWLSGLGWGCMRDMAEDGSLGLGTSFGCLRFIVGFGVPLTVAMCWMTRHASAIRPGPVAALGGLAAAAVCSVGLSLIHHLDAAAMILLWHGGSIVIVTLVAWAFGPRVMRVAAA